MGAVDVSMAKSLVALIIIVFCLIVISRTESFYEVVHTGDLGAIGQKVIYMNSGAPLLLKDYGPLDSLLLEK